LAKTFSIPIELAVALPITIPLGLRVLDIAQSWVNVFLVKQDPKILYPVRALVLTIINYIELILSFSVLGFIWNNTFKPEPFHNLGDSLVFTLGTMTTIGSKYEPFSTGAWTIYILEIAFGLFFLIVVIVRALHFFEQRRK